MNPLIIAALALLPAARPAGAPHDTLAAWRHGPIRYVITAEEDREFRQLDDDQARERFIENFWARRDTDPRTLVNEYRMQFWERVATANQMFSGSAKPGWKTDQGRLLLVLGPPDDMDTSRDQPRGSGARATRGTITWRYSHSPRPGIGAGLTLVFSQDASGEYRLESDPLLIEEALMTGMVPPDSLRALGAPLPQLPARLTELGLMLDLGRLEEVPSEEELLTAIVTARELYGSLPFSARYDFFSGSGGQTLVAITLSLYPDPLVEDRAAAAPGYLMVGRLRRIDGAETLYLREREFQAAAIPSNADWHGPWLYQTVVPMPPGIWQAGFVAVDPSSRRAGTYAEEIDVPAFHAGRLSLSSLCLSERIEAVKATQEPPAAYVIGHLKVTPRLLPQYRNGETFAVYYQVYAAARQSGGAPRLAIDYQFYVNQGGSYIPIGRPIRIGSSPNMAQGWTFPLRDWPTGEFRLRVTVTDESTSQSASREVTFRVL